MGTLSGTAARNVPPMRWFAGVPIATNPLTLRDLSLTLAALGVGSTLFAMAVHALFGTSSFQTIFLNSATLGGYLVASIAAIFLAVSILFGNHLVVLYRFQDDSLYCETMRGSLAAPGAFFHCRPFRIASAKEPGRSVSKVIAWDDVRSIECRERDRVILLKGNRGTLARVYCPDGETFAEASAALLSLCPAA
ncbi:hypothetical protein LWX53_01170 [bacterium]|nr:hypothetical protein [bacterium]